MILTWTPYSLIPAVAAALGLALSLYTWHRRSVPGSVAFTGLMLAATVWALMSALEKAALGTTAKVLFAKFQYLGIASVPPLWFMFALEYTRQNQWLTRRTLLLLWLIPVATLVIVATNEWHGLVWSNIVPSPIAPETLLVYEHGAWFYVAAAYNYLLILVGTIALIWAIFRFPLLYRNQAATLLAGVAIPWVTNVIYLLGLHPLPGVDPTPLAFTLTGLIYVIGIFRFRLFDVMPVAREAVLESLRDGVIVLDPVGRIVDINPAGQTITGYPAKSLVGRVAGEVWPQYLNLFTPASVDAPMQTEVMLTVSGETRFYDVHLSPLHNPGGRLGGWTVVLRDVSDRKRFEEVLQQREENFRRLFEANPFPSTLVRLSDFRVLLSNQAVLDFFEFDSNGPDNAQALPVLANTDYRTQILEQIRANGTASNLMVEVQTYKGGHKWGILNALPVNVYGEPCLLIGLADMTERRSAEQKLVATNTELNYAMHRAHELAVLAEIHAREANTLREAGTIVAATLNPAEAIERVLEQLARVVPYECAWVQLRRGDETEVIGGRGFIDVKKVIGSRYPINQDEPSGSIYLSGQTITLADAQNSRFAAFRDPQFSYIRSWMAVPLMIRDRMVGLLSLDSTEVDHFTPHHLELAQVFATQAAIAFDNARLFEDAQRLAITDELTGLYNRRYFFQHAEIELERAQRYQHPLSAILMDADLFKDINDTYGHAAGDQVLKRLAEECRRNIRNVDLLARYGGEEFAFLLPATDGKQALIVAERLLANIAQMVVNTERGSITLTVSLGLATVDESCENLDVLLEHCDRALYTAKHRGRSQVVAWPLD